jgi:hypothetical protein
MASLSLRERAGVRGKEQTKDFESGWPLVARAGRNSHKQ